MERLTIVSLDVYSQFHPVKHCLCGVNETPIKRHPHLAPMEVFERKFSVLHYFDLPSPLIHRLKLQRRNSGALSAVGGILSSTAIYTSHTRVRKMV